MQKKVNNIQNLGPKNKAAHKPKSKNTLLCILKFQEKPFIFVKLLWHCTISYRNISQNV